jgi:hypothetical protein
MKKDLVNAIVEKVESVDCDIVRIYGVVCGVGYDLDITVKLKGTSMELYIPAHASPKSWASYWHQRPNKTNYKNPGRNDVYRAKVIDDWEKRHGLESLLHRFKMDELKDMLNYLE